MFHGCSLILRTLDFFLVAFSLNSWCIEDAMGAFVYFHANSLGSCRNRSSFFIYIFFSFSSCSWSYETFLLFFSAYGLGSWRSTFFVCANSCSSGTSFFCFSLNSWRNGALWFGLFLMLQFKLMKQWSIGFFLRYSLSSWSYGAFVFFTVLAHEGAFFLC